MLARLTTLRATWIEDRVVQAAWRGVVAAIARATAGWPRIIADRIATESDPSRLSEPDAVVLVAPPADECAAADALVRKVLADPEGWPRPEREVLERATGRGISAWALRREAVRRGIVIREGRWDRPEPGRRPWLEPGTVATMRALDLAEAEARTPAPLIRPLLRALHARMLTEPACAELDRVLAEPAKLPPPRAPRTSPAARAQWLRARTAYTRERIAIRRGHRRRAELAPAIDAACAAFRAAWWSWPSITEAGDATAVRAAAEQLRTEALARLRSLGKRAAAAAATTGEESL